VERTPSRGWATRARASAARTSGAVTPARRSWTGLRWAGRGARRLTARVPALATPRAAAAVALTIALAAYLLGPPGGDAAAHLYQTGVWRQHGWRLWDNFWYAGRYSQVNYSLLYYPVAALFGTAPAVCGAAAGAAAAFAQLVRRQWPALATGPAIAFALLVPLAVLAGTYPFLLALALGLATLAAAQAGRFRLALAATLATALAHPLAFVFLAAVLAGIAASSRGWWRRPGARLFAVGVVLVGAGQAIALRAFAASGAYYPFDPRDAVAIAGFCVVGAALSWRVPGQRPLPALFAGYAAIATAAWVVPSPIGSNAVRLLLLMGTPLLLLPLAARRFRPRVLAVGCLAGALLWQALPAVAGWRAASGARASGEAFWYPVEAFLDRHHDPSYRVEVVATVDNWEAFYLARRGVALARGWFRQDDWPENAVLYENLTPRRYQAWMRRMAVRYVLLPDDPLDASAQAEARVLRAGSGLRTVARLGGWTVFELPDATPIATPRRDVRVLAMTADTITLRVLRPGRYQLRLRYTPYWRVVRGEACAGPRAPWGTDLQVSKAGIVRLRFDVRFGTLVSAVLGGRGGCAAPAIAAPGRSGTRYPA
jgi:hypothetical protein